VGSDQGKWVGLIPNDPAVASFALMDTPVAVLRKGCSLDKYFNAEGRCQFITKGQRCIAIVVKDGSTNQRKHLFNAHGMQRPDVRLPTHFVISLNSTNEFTFVFRRMIRNKVKPE
jgi:hypothetical protein